MIFLDMDGPLVDFHGGAFKAFGKTFDPDEYPQGVWDIETVIGVSKTEFWNTINAMGSDFWVNLEPQPWIDDLLSVVSLHDEWTILTSPSRSPESKYGKAIWLETFFGLSFENYLFAPGRQKHLLSTWDRAVLVDDKPSNVKDFGKKGQGILFPAKWNDEYENIGNPVPFVDAALKASTLVFNEMETL